MSFLDNLENNLKALEGREESGAQLQDHSRREAERQRAIAAAPYAERLKSGPFTDALLTEAMRAGRAARTLVNATWLGTTLRLQARERKLDLRPTAEGVMAVFIDGTNESNGTVVDLDGNPADLIRRLLETQ